MSKSQHWTLGFWDVAKKADFWQKLAKKINAEFKIFTTVSKDLSRLQLTFVYDNAQVKFTESDTKPLFVECNFNRNMPHVWFEISQSDFIDKIMSLLSKHKIKSRNKKFNQSYIVKSNDNHRVIEIINNQNIAETILRENIMFIGAEPVKNGAYRLQLSINRNINNFQQLEAVYNLTISLIDILNGK